MKEGINLLTIDNLTKQEILNGTGLSVNDVHFCFEIPVKVFDELLLPPSSQMFDMHYLAKTLLTLDSKGIKELFVLAVELEEAMQITNHQGILGRLKSNDFDKYLSARGEIKAGAWARNGLNSVEFIVPKSKKGKTVDLKCNGNYGEILVEVKSENQFDLNVGLNGMFKGWIRNHILQLFPSEDTKMEVSFGSYWVDAIGAACRINQNMRGASWAFHTLVMMISDIASPSSTLLEKKW